jgi:hypothetical protein
LFNCLAFWIFGRAVEQRYGQREYIAFFLAAIVFAGLTWLIGEWISRPQRSIPMLGASGGIAAVLLLFCLNFPRQNIYIWGVFPLPAWLFAILFVGQDLLFAVQRRPDDHVAFLAHLGGAGFAVIYFKFGLRIAGWLPDASWLARLRPRPKLRVRFAEDEEDTDELVDEILQKIQEHGQDSLTRRERQILEQASREYQKRRK